MISRRTGSLDGDLPIGLDLAAIGKALDARAEAARTMPVILWILPASLIGGSVLGWLGFGIATRL